MVRHAARGVVRTVRRTLLVVGEGYAEVALLRHVRQLYTRDGIGCAMSIANARGKGAQHVVEVAVRSAGAHDTVAALLDTDAAWHAGVAARARRGRIAVLMSEPCLEAWLLRIHGDQAERASAVHKLRFAAAFGGDAHDEGLLSKHFPRTLLDRARERVSVLDQLLRLVLA